jgi:hypothetical protein
VLEPKLVDKVRILRQQPALQLVALLTRHGRDVEWIAAGGLFVLLLLELPPLDELNVRHGSACRRARVLVIQTSTQGLQDFGPIVVQGLAARSRTLMRACRRFSAAFRRPATPTALSNGTSFRCPAHLSIPVTAHAPQRSPFFLMPEQRRR